MSGSGIKFGKKTKKKEELWLMSFADMTFLLLAFFVMLLSMSTPNKKRYEHVADTIQKELNPRTKENLQELFEKIGASVKDQGLESKVGVVYDNNGVHVEFKDGVLFASGSANPNKAMEDTHSKLRVILTTSP
jgi:chemotaxis protein MotB